MVSHLNDYMAVTTAQTTGSHEFPYNEGPHPSTMRLFSLVLSALFLSQIAMAEAFHVGPGQALSNIGDVPWAALDAGDQIYIHYRPEPYFEKWVINAQGNAENPIEVIGVLGPGGEKPIIDGNGAITPTELDYWGENRGIIKIGGASIPSDGLPSYITIENLEVRSGRPAYTFSNDAGAIETYASNCAAIYIEKGAHIVIRNCDIHDSGNGIFIGAFGGQTQDILLTGNYIYNNGIEGSIFEHNTYTEALGITYEYNRFGPLRSGALGNNLKDRSAGLVVRYNWIESGNRQLDLVDASNGDALVNHTSYSTTFVYGNILIEPDGAGNSQIVHYGGDSGVLDDYRKGTLYFFNNTVVSTRSGNTTLVRLSTMDETMTAFNNVVYNTAAGSNMALLDNTGVVNLENNWLPDNWVVSHSAMGGTINDPGNNLTGSDPMFNDFSEQDFTPVAGSALINAGTGIPLDLLPEHDLTREYVKHSSGADRNIAGPIDIGAFEYNTLLSVPDQPSSAVRMFPNPATATIQVETDNFEGVQIYSGTHALVLESNNPITDISALADGVYVVKIKHNDRVALRRLVKH